MRILMACAAFPPFMDGGGPISSMMIAKTLIAAGHDVLVVNVAGEDKHEVYEGVPVHRLPSLNIDWNYRLPRPAWKKLAWHAIENFNPRAFFAMRREIRAFRPDVVFTVSIENINVATWAAAKSLDVPTAHMLFSTFLICWKGSMRRGDHNCRTACASCRAASPGKKLLTRYVDLVMGETDFIIDCHLSEGYFPKAFRRTVPGIIPSVAAPVAKESVENRPIRFGFIGLHDKVKGLDTLAAAAHRLAGNKNVTFLIAGTGNSDYARDVHKSFPASNTRFLGWSKPDAFFPQIDVSIVPSLFNEPFGRVVVEAFSHGVPVIGARSGGIPQSIREGVDGFVFPAGDDAALAELIQAIANHPQRLPEMSQAALASAHRYVPDRIAALFDEAFDELLAKRPSKATRKAA
ncbi:glycosyltransferase [Oryzifoliimicrobium ureilyticus]|uniref:glycosyltransferase n=1 Tax=Oryzifoliimicrobium ureilyticus TaxID=3113724 RepID=UPI0030764471